MYVRLLEETTSSWVNTAQYEWGNGLVRCNSEFPLTDGRGNVRLTTNGSQQVTSSNQPNADGLGSVTGGTASAYSYGASSGYRQDGVGPAGLGDSYGFQKVGARYYDPLVGGFLTRDTDLTQSPYAYCNGDTVNFTDPTGHDDDGNPPLNKDRSLAVIAIGVALIALAAIATLPLWGVYAVVYLGIAVDIFLGIIKAGA